jgi:alkylhydroperoxidase family enzyme
VKLALRPADVDERDLDGLRAHGFDDDDIWDIGAITALFALSNRMAHFAAIRPNEEFFSMAREPRSR